MGPGEIADSTVWDTLESGLASSLSQPQAKSKTDATTTARGVPESFEKVLNWRERRVGEMRNVLFFI